MATEKHPLPTVVEAETPTPAINAFNSHTSDQHAMHRMGKTQELHRVFRQFSLVSFTAIIMGTWQWILLANTQGLTNGGRGGLFWSYIWTLCGYIFLAASLADMASMAPTAGGQYHWVSEFAPRSVQKPLSYAAGWLSTLAWQAGNASGFYLNAYIVQAMIVIKHPEYSAPAWQGWLIVIAMTVVTVAFNVWAEPILPGTQSVFMPVYIAAFVATAAVLWGLCPHVDGYTALMEITNGGGWSSDGLALMVGQVSAVFALGGCDSAAHMSEEVTRSGLTVPRAMVWSFLINAGMGFVALIPFLFACQDIDAAVNDPSGLPLVYVLNLAGMPDLTVGLLFIQLLIFMVSTIAYQAAVARTTFAFARDGGLPFSRTFGTISPKWHVPTNAILLTGGITIILCVIGVGSSDAINAIFSLAAVSMMATYCVSITCVLWRRIAHPETLPKASWGLGRYGIPVNAIGAAYAWFAFFWAFWPIGTPVTAESMNYAVVMFGGVMILSFVYYLVKARKSYAGPVVLVKREEDL